MKRSFRIICTLLILAISICTFGYSSAAEQELHHFNASLTESFGKSTEEWVESESNRTLLACSLLLDASVRGDCPYPDLCSTDGQLYVGVWYSADYPTLGVISIHPEYDEILFILFLEDEDNSQVDTTWNVVEADKNQNSTYVENVFSVAFPDGFYKLENNNEISNALDELEKKLKPSISEESKETKPAKDLSSLFQIAEDYLCETIAIDNWPNDISDVSSDFDYAVSFYMQPGNKYFSITIDNSLKSYNPFRNGHYEPMPDDELLASFFNLIKHFDDIQKKLPGEKKFTIRIVFPDVIYTVSNENIGQVTSWMQQ